MLGSLTGRAHSVFLGLPLRHYTVHDMYTTKDWRELEEELRPGLQESSEQNQIERSPFQQEHEHVIGDRRSVCQTRGEQHGASRRLRGQGRVLAC